jgi:hypothetical protein
MFAFILSCFLQLKRNSSRPEVSNIIVNTKNLKHRWETFSKLKSLSLSSQKANRVQEFRSVPSFVNYHSYELKQRYLSTFLSVREFFRLSRLFKVILLSTRALLTMQVCHSSRQPEQDVGPWKFCLSLSVSIGHGWMKPMEPFSATSERVPAGATDNGSGCTTCINTVSSPGYRTHLRNFCHWS